MSLSRAGDMLRNWNKTMDPVEYTNQVSQENTKPAYGTKVTERKIKQWILITLYKSVKSP